MEVYSMGMFPRSKAPSDRQWLFVEDIERALGIKCNKRSKDNIGIWIETHKEEYYKVVKANKEFKRHYPVTAKQKKMIKLIENTMWEKYEMHVYCDSTDKQGASNFIEIYKGEI